MTTHSNRPQPLSKNKTRKNIKEIWQFYDTTKTKQGKLSVIEKGHSIQIKDNQNECCKKQSNLVLSDDGFITCSVCAFTSTDIVDSAPEWRFYGADDNKGGGDPTRCGMPANNLFENNLTCSFQPGHSSAFKKNIASLIRYTNSSNLSHKDKSLMEDIQRLTQLGIAANFTQCIIDYAINIHKRIINYLDDSDVHFRSYNKDSILFGDFDLACKSLDVPRTAKELAMMWNCEIQCVTAGCKIVQTVFAQLEKNVDDDEKITSKHTSASCFISRFCSNLQINSQQFIKLCQFVINKGEKMDLLHSHTSQSIAAGTILFLATATNISLAPLSINKDVVAKATGVSDVTIAKINAKLLEQKTKLIPSKMLK